MMSSQVDLGLGYPTFTTAIDEAHVKEQIIMMGMPFGESGPGDAAYKYIMQPANQQPGMVFVEVTDTRSGSHLGYIFTIDEQKVFCINAAALHFVPHGSQIPEKVSHPHSTSVHLHNLDPQLLLSLTILHNRPGSF